MKILIERSDFGKDDVIGNFIIDKVKQCLTLEDQEQMVKVHGETCIPVGIYKLGRRWSPKFSPKYNHEMLWIKDVPGFQYILIHPGNTDDDTEGCILVGNERGILNGKRAVLDSRNAYKKIYKIITAALDKGEEVTIEVINKKKAIV